MLPKGSSCRSLNCSFIALIPKKIGAIELKDSQPPICLVGNFYKIISKTSARRMKGVMNCIISPAYDHVH